MGPGTIAARYISRVDLADKTLTSQSRLHGP
jgi:hypothetical protein